MTNTAREHNRRLVLARRPRGMIDPGTVRLELGPVPRAPGPPYYLNLLLRRGRMEGFQARDYAGRFAEARADMATTATDTRARRMTRRSATLVMLLALGVAGLPSPARADDTPAKPTIVLVHGAWDRAASWDDVAARLRSDGYPVVAPDNPLRSLAGDAAATRHAIDRIAGPIVLVGHSYGGAVITDAALGDQKVRALVYIAAFAPERGESILQLGARVPGSLVPASLLAVPFVGPDGPGVDLYLNRLLYPTAMAADVPPATAQAMARNQHPLTLKALTDPSGPPAWRSIPSWYMVARQDSAVPPSAERFMARRAGSHTVEIDSSHAALVSHPSAVADLIRSAASGSRLGRARASRPASRSSRRSGVKPGLRPAVTAP